jgi:hypothetical protein
VSIVAAPASAFSFAAAPGWFELTLPIKTVSEANARGKWQQVDRRAAQRKIVKTWIGKDRPYHSRLPSLPVVVRLARIGGKALDPGDNLPAALKAVRDEVAAAYGVGDGADSPLTFDYWQVPGGRELAVQIQIYSADAAPVLDAPAPK